MAFLTEIPSIYHPHDLQHVHLPELFPPRDIELRELWYRAFCEQAELVVMMTQWGRNDVIAHYGLDPAKVIVVPWGSMLGAYSRPSPEQLGAVRRDLDLPDRFPLCPAQTWAHKNHERLLDALSVVRERRGVEIPLVCTGHLNDFHDSTLAPRVRELGLSGSVRFLGFVSPDQLNALYALAAALVFPSRFEGWGMPVSEAFESGLPVASSHATGMREVVGDAGILFDPEDVEEIADAVWALWSDDELRDDLVERGRARVASSDVMLAARRYRACYRRILGHGTTPDDDELLSGLVGAETTRDP